MSTKITCSSSIVVGVSASGSCGVATSRAATELTLPRSPPERGAKASESAFQDFGGLQERLVSRSRPGDRDKSGGGSGAPPPGSPCPNPFLRWWAKQPLPHMAQSPLKQRCESDALLLPNTRPASFIACQQMLEHEGGQSIEDTSTKDTIHKQAK